MNNSLNPDLRSNCAPVSAHAARLARRRNRWGTILALLTCLSAATPGTAANPETVIPAAGTGTSTNPYDNSHSPLGVGLIWITEWESMLPFINVFKKARPWSSNQGALDLDDNGWVRSLAAGQTASTAVLSPNTPTQQALPHKFPSGDYVLTYEGDGTLSILGSAVTEIVNLGPRRFRVHLDFASASAGFSLRLDSTAPGNYLKNIKIHLPGGVCNHDAFAHADTAAACPSGTSFEPYEAVNDEFVFYAPFLNNMKYFKAIRYLQALSVNGATLSEASELKTIDAATYWNQMPAEVMVMLSNRLNADVWLNLPHRASDAFVNHFASILQQQLNANLKVYVEFSNEVWNGAFPYSMHAHDLAATGCPRYADLTDCDQDSTPNNGVLCEGWPWPTQNAHCMTARNRYFSDRTVEVGQIFIDVFGGGERVVRVMGGWTQNNYNEALLTHNNNYQRVDAVAIGSYFGGYIPSNLNNAQIIQSWIDQGGQAHAMDLLFQEILQGGALRPYYLPGGQYYDPARPAWQIPPANGAVNALVDSFAGMVASVGQYGLELVSYEGGPHLDVTVNGNSTGVRDLVLAAHHDPRMGQAYQAYLQGWRNSGGGILMLYTSHSSSSGFGLLEYEQQPHAQQPKFLTVQQFIADNACWWAGCAPELFRDGFE